MGIVNDLSDRVSRLPIAYGRHAVKGFLTKHLVNFVGTDTQVTIQQALGAGPWDSIEKLYYGGEEITGANYRFHSGIAADAVDDYFPSDIVHPNAAYYSALLPVGMADDNNPDKMVGLFKTIQVADYNNAGVQTAFGYSANPARQILDLMLRAKRSVARVNYPAWVAWRDYCDALIDWDDGALTPHQVSLALHAGGALIAGQRYWVRIATIKGADISSASHDRASDGVTTASIVVSGGNLSFDVTWASQEDRGATGYRVYIGTAEGAEDRYFTVGSGATNTLTVSTLAGATMGPPPETATGALLRSIPRFQSHIFFQPPIELSAAFDKIAQITCMDWQYAGGKLVFLTPEARDPVFTLNLSEATEFKTYQVDRRQKPNQIIVNYRDLDDQYLSQADPPVEINRSALQAKEGVRPFTIEGGTMYRSQALRVGNYWAKRLIDSDQMLEVLGSPRTYIVLPGDPIAVTHDVPNWADVQFYVESKEETEDSKAGYQITGRIYGAWYSDTDQNPLPRPLPSPNPSPLVAPDIVSSVVLAQVDRSLASGIPYTAVRGDVQFQPFAGTQIGRVWVKDPDDIAYRATHLVLSPDPATLLSSFELPAAPSGIWDFVIVTESTLGVSKPFGDHAVYEIEVVDTVGTVGGTDSVVLVDEDTPGHNLVLVSRSNPVLTADRTLTLNVKDGNRQLILGGDLSVGSLSNGAVFASSGVIASETHLALSRGGTNSDLGATGGASQYLKQSSAGAAITVGTIAAADLPGSFAGFANPSAQVGLSVVNGSAATAMRSDAAPALDQGITPTWTQNHIWQKSAPLIELKNTTGNQRWQFRNGGAATGIFDLYDASNSKTLLAVTTTEVRIGSATNQGGAGNASRFYVYGGPNGANVDIQGDATAADQATLELESSDYSTSLKSLRMQVYGTSGIGTTFGFANQSLGGLVWQGLSTALVYTDNATPIIWGTNSTQRMSLSASAPALTIGVANSSLGQLKLTGNTSGTVTVQPAAAAGTWSFTLPTTGGTNGYFLATDGSGGTSWVTRTLTAGAGLTGGGDLTTDRTLTVGAGTLITVGADDVGITPGAADYGYIGSTTTPWTATWRSLSTLAGAGLTHTAGVLAVGAGDGITVNADDVALTTPGTLTVSSSNSSSGNHTHAITSSANPGAAAALLASQAASPQLTLPDFLATGNVFIRDTSTGFTSPGTTVVSPVANNAFRSTSYTSGLVGWNVNASGNAEFANLDVRGSIRSAVFVYNALLATSGTLGVFKAAAKLKSDVTVTAAPTYGTTTFTIDAVDQDGLTHAASQLFVVNDILRLKDGLIGDTWFKVTAVSDQTTFWRYTASIQAGTANVTYRSGMAIADYGLSGAGFIIQTADQTNAPYLQMATHAATFSSADASGSLMLTVGLRLGNLNGSYGFASDTFGFGTGQYGVASKAWITVEQTNGFRIGNNTTTLGQWTTAGVITIGQVAASQSNIQISSGALDLRVNTTIRTHLATDGSGYFANSAFAFDTSGNVSITGNATIAAWTIGATRISSTHVFIDNAGEYISMGATPPTSYGSNVGVFLEGANSGRLSLYKDANNYLQWDSTKLLIKAANFTLDSSGNVTASSATLSGAITATSGSITGDMNIGTGGDIRSGATAVLTGDGWWIDYNAGTPRFRVGTITAGALTKGLYWDGSNLQIKGTNTTLDSSGNLTASSATLSGAITATSGSFTGAVTITSAGGSFALGSTAPTSATAGTGIWMDRTVISGVASSKQTFALSATDGTLKLGSDLSAASTTAFVVAGTAITYNSESLGAGAVLFGDNSSTKANVLYSSGAVKFRRGTTDYITIDSTDAQFTNLIKMSGANAAISIGSTPPTSATAGTGLWLDRNGLIGLSAGTQLFALNSTGLLTSSLTVGTVVSGGISIPVVSIGANGNYLGLGSIDTSLTDSATNSISNVLRLEHSSSGTVATNFGAGIVFDLASTAFVQNAARIGAIWTTATDASRTSAFVIQTVNSAAALAEVARFAGNGDATFTGVIKMGSGPTTVTDSAGKVLSAALNTVGVAQGGTGLTTFTSNTVYKGNSTSALATSQITDDGSTVGINVSSLISGVKLQVRTGTDQNFTVQPKIALSTGVVFASLNDANSAGQGFEIRGSVIQLTASGNLGLVVNATGGITVGSPTGGDKGSGTINAAGDIYKNGTAFTNPDYVFEHWATGQIVRHANKRGAFEYKGLMPIKDLRDFTRKHYHLHRFGPGHGQGLFDGGESLLAHLEEAHLYIFELEERVTKLEGRAA